MAKSRGDFTELLLRRQILSPDQLAEAKSLQQLTGAKLADCIVKLGHAFTEQVMCAIAEVHDLQFVDLTEVTIPPGVIELVPEAVARENVILPLSQEAASLKIVMSDPKRTSTRCKSLPSLFPEGKLLSCSMASTSITPRT